MSLDSLPVQTYARLYLTNRYATEVASDRAIGVSLTLLTLWEPVCARKKTRVNRNYDLAGGSETQRHLRLVARGRLEQIGAQIMPVLGIVETVLALRHLEASAQELRKHTRAHHARAELGLIV